MNVQQAIAALYASHFAAGHTFEADLAAHLRSGYVWASPAAFVMARLVRSDWTWAEWGNLELSDPDGDCWCVWIAAGDLAEFFRVCPRETKFACYSRRGFPRLWEFRELQRLCCHGIHAKTASSAPSASCSFAGA